jgi:hypothetical protein
MLVTQQTAGYNGILWDLMGYRWESAEICGFFLPFNGLDGLLVGGFSLWISL